MQEYSFKTIEAKWQKIWEDAKYSEAVDFSDKPKHYHLVEFPYPSGTGLHVGHCMGYGASDAYSRMKRMQGFNVMYPMGWDAFGLPTENYAIKTKQKPQDVTRQNVEVFKKQIKSLGYSFDFNREVNTTDPSYYKWTQWIFLQFYKHGVVDDKLIEVADSDTTTPRLAFQAEMPVNWCPSCKIVLANEEVVNGACERCGTDSEKRVQKQWMLRITAYADKLIKGLDSVNYLDKIRTQQINWIGKSEGAEIKFPISNSQLSINVFTTRADTLFGCTYIVIAPESKYLTDIKSQISNIDEVEKYIQDAKKKSDLERTELQKDKTGVKLQGVKAINPINNEEVDVYVADYVLASYGTGAVMAVPSHDDRDFEFAKKYGIEIKDVIIPKVVDKKNPPKDGFKTVERRAIQGILIDPKTNKVLTLKWKKFDWTTFITGGVEENEDIVESAKREILEETGYKNIKYVKTLGGPVESHFFAAHKNENRKAMFSALVFELVDDEKNDLSDAENAIHELSWMTWDEVTKDKNLTCAEYEIWLDRFNNAEHAFTDYGVLVNSQEFDGLTSAEAKKAITQKLKDNDLGEFTTNFKLRDWIFSRQHYWGEPIPIIHCDKCGKVPVSETDLPLTLPDVENYEPTDNGESPLSAMTDWVNTTCPACGALAKRETDTMPNWAGSSWYYLRYCDPKNDRMFASDSYRKEEIKATEKDLSYIEEFKKIYTDLDLAGVRTWATNRFLLNGLNHSLWLPLRTISVMVFEKDIPVIEKYILENGYKEEKVYAYGKLYLKGDIRFEYVTVFVKNGEYSSLSEKGALQKMKKEDLPESIYGHLNGFNYRIVSPEYNLQHYKFINEFENDTRTGLGDDEKIKFLEKYVQTTNKNLEYWMNVDIYNGGMEHNNLHLLYSRFWHLFLYDLGVVTTPEPYAKRIAHGIILGPDGQKMSKSKGNVINPDSIVDQFGADTLRAYVMFIGPYDQESAWNNAGVMGVHRFLKRVWQNANLVNDKPDTDELLVKLNQTIQGITDDLEAFRMNTVISKLMEMNNMIEKVGSVSKTSYQSFLKLLSVSCPFISEELWETLGFEGLVSASNWPKADEKYLVASKITMAIQINGKLRDTIEVESNASEAEIVEIAQNTDKIKPLLSDTTIKKTIFVPKRLINFVI